MKNVTQSLAILGALVVALSPGAPLVASPADEITRAVAVRGLSDPARAPAKDFMSAFTAVVLQAEPGEVSKYVAAAVKLRPDLAPRIVAAAVRVGGNSHSDRAMSVSLPNNRKEKSDENCALLTDIIKAAVAVNPEAVAEIAGAAAGANRDMRQCIIEAAVSAVPSAEAEIIQAVNAATILSPLQSISVHGPLYPSDFVAVVVSPEKPPGL